MTKIAGATLLTIAFIALGLLPLGNGMTPQLVAPTLGAVAAAIAGTALIAIPTRRTR